MLNVGQEIHPTGSLGQETELMALFDALLVTLRQEIDVYRELRETVLTEKDVLKRSSVDELIESNTKKETVILKAKMLEEVKTNTSKKIARMVGYMGNDIHMTMLSTYADGERKKALNACQSILRKLTVDINKTNHNNMEFMSISLQSIVGSINFLHNIIFAGDTYSGEGKMATLNPNGRFINAEG
jgi:flagellar biosynthesis/type III secretory pathway chaperone